MSRPLHQWFPGRWLIVLLLLGVIGCGATPPRSAHQSSDSVAPEAASGITPQSKVSARHFMVATANPYATDTGYAVLKAGGSAVDAMIAVQAVLTLVEPQSSGIGGGALLLYWEAATRHLSTLDGRETAPAAATAGLFLDDQGQPLPFYDAVVGGRSVGTPGTLQLMWQAHRRYGKLPWRELFVPAITLARDGFVVSPRLATLIARDSARLRRYPDTRRYFFHADGSPLQPDERKQNPELVKTLQQIAAHGPVAFYAGPLASAMVARVQQAPGNPGKLALTDLAGYRVKARPPVCLAYLEYQICGMGPPSSGGLSVAQILGMLQHTDFATRTADDPQAWRLLGDASRLTFADRDRYMADTDFVTLPIAGLLDDGYLRRRAALLERHTALPQVNAGKPPGTNEPAQAPDHSLELPSTSHISIVDGAGNALSMTTTIENGFGSRLMVGGFLLNNELTDFSFVPEQDGTPVANRLQPGKRPRSSMAPTIVLKEGKPYLLIGSPGGSRIIGYVLQTLVGMLNWDMDIQQAINQPHLLNRFGTYELEAGTGAEQWAQPLELLGYEVRIDELNSGLHGIQILPHGLEGGADPRREGSVRGD